jgi:ribosomal protein S26
MGAVILSSFWETSTSQANFELDLCVSTAAWSRYLSVVQVRSEHKREEETSGT